MGRGIFRRVGAREFRKLETTFFQGELRQVYRFLWASCTQSPQFYADIDAGDFAEGLALVRHGERRGYLDKTGNLVIELHFDGFYAPSSLIRLERWFGVLR